MDSVNKCSSFEEGNGSVDAAGSSAEDPLLAAQSQIKFLQDMLCSVLSINKASTDVRSVVLDGHRRIRLSDGKPAELGCRDIPACSNVEDVSHPPCAAQLAERYGVGLASDGVRDRVPGSSFDNASFTPANVTPKCEHNFNLPSMLPRLEIMSFSGDPMKFWLFMRSFETNIMNCVHDPTSRLAYLIQYCQGKAREAIESCAILQPEEGFQDAMATLKTRFGRPFMIARAHINNLVNGPPVRPNDFEELSKLGCDMKACLNTLSQLMYDADLNASATLSAVVRRLPRSLQFDWCKKASAILSDAREPSFKDLYEFIDGCAQITSAQSMCMILPEPRQNYNPRPTRCENKSTSFATLLATGVNEIRQGPASPCLQCHGMHYLDQSQQFREMNADERLVVTRKNKLCEQCLKTNHSAKDCRSRRSCGMNECQARHHPLLHAAVPLQSVNAQLTINNAVTAPSAVSLGVVPVRICGDGKTLITNALLDSGSDSSLIDEALLEQLGLNTEMSEVDILTVNKGSRMKS